MRKFLIGIVSAIAALFLVSAPSSANIQTLVDNGAKPLVQKVHGFHLGCSWDAFGWHSHLPILGRVPCSPGIVRPYPRFPHWHRHRHHRRHIIRPHHRRHVIRPHRPGKHHGHHRMHHRR